MSRILVFIILHLAGDAAMADECVILLHGLGRTSLSMLSLQRSLQAEGYSVWNRGYASTRKSIEELSLVVGRAIDSCVEEGAETINFVTHSLGGILVRQYFQNHNIPNAGRVVMLGPPNHGSEIVDQFKDRWWFRLATGPAGQELGTGSESVPNSLKPVNIDVGVIAGRKTSDPWFSELFAGENDGKVSLASAQLEGMKDFLIVENGHTFMANSQEVGRQVLAFLRTGKFEKI
jgi:pimeloyl-ACP methyl ester carboxylesterase